MTSSLRLTRRGRVVIGTLFAIPVLAFLMLLASPGALAGDDVVENDYDYVTVLAGDTLWDIASLVEPAADPRDVVAEIMSLNRLTNAVLTPGQQLAIPR